MHWSKILAFIAALINVSGQAQTAFKLLIRSTRPFFAPGEPLKLEVACVSVPGIEPGWQERWNSACHNAKLEIEEARLGGYWGGVGSIDWLQNRLHLCLLPAGESYEEKSYFRYTQPQWQSITVPAKRLSNLRGMIQINAQVALKDGENQLDQEFAQVVTAIVSDADDTEGTLSSDIQRDAAAVQSGDPEKNKRLANALLGHPTKGALRMAVRLFDNTVRTGPLWTVIENSPHQQAALDLMLARLKDLNFVPDYELLLNLTGIKARLDKPLEFDAENRQPYTEYHADLEDSSVAYFRSLLNSLVTSSDEPLSVRAIAIADIASSVAESDRLSTRHIWIEFQRGYGDQIQVVQQITRYPSCLTEPLDFKSRGSLLLN